MKIGVISDTHLLHCDEILLRIVENHFKDVDIILHAGDLVSLDVLDAFRGKKVMAVCGNMDGAEVRKSLGEKMLIEAEGFRIGLIHGWGMPFGIEKKLRKQFDDIDCLVYGHTHHASINSKDGILYFNPGSATDRRFTKRNTVGILELGEQIVGKIISLPD